MKVPFRPAALFLSLACLFLVNQATAANVGPAGYTTTFGAQPDAADWATLSIVGNGNDVYTMDNEVLTNSLFAASSVTAQCNSSNSVTPTQISVAVWSTSGYLQTRPTGNKYTILMGKFVNTSGSNATASFIRPAATNASSSCCDTVLRGELPGVP